ncbi:MAG: hydroxymethylbilane synthase [Deltaproteobacteria bacterium]|nr:hydroxymethylbilane synthase [Deltaproteobacteria bacterium]
MSRRFVVGTRGSALARWQTDHVNQRLREHAGDRAPDVAVRVITTQGDVNLAERLAGTLEKGFFTAELEAALHAGEIDWAVHSLKDLPTRMPAGLTLVAVLERASPADLLVICQGAFDERNQRPDALPLTAGARVGTSSLRRDAMLKAFAPACSSLPLRGNVPTRVDKLRAGNYDAIVLAEAGLSRLGLSLEGLVVLRLDPRAWQPAPGQGAVAVQARAGDDAVRALFAPIDHEHTRAATALERAFLRELEGGCTTPFGAFVDAERVHLGLARPAGWASLVSQVVGEQQIADVLAELHRQQEPRHEHTRNIPLWRRL